MVKQVQFVSCFCLNAYAHYIMFINVDANYCEHVLCNYNVYCSPNALVAHALGSTYRHYLCTIKTQCIYLLIQPILIHKTYHKSSFYWFEIHLQGYLLSPINCIFLEHANLQKRHRQLRFEIFPSCSLKSSNKK